MTVVLSNNRRKLEGGESFITAAGMQAKKEPKITGLINVDHRISALLGERDGAWPVGVRVEPPSIGPLHGFLVLPSGELAVRAALTLEIPCSPQLVGDIRWEAKELAITKPALQSTQVGVTHHRVKMGHGPDLIVGGRASQPRSTRSQA